MHLSRNHSSDNQPMNHQPRTVRRGTKFALLAMLCGGLFAASTQAQNTPVNGATKIGTVNVAKVFGGTKEIKDAQTSAETHRFALEQSHKDHQHQLEMMKNSLSQLAAGSQPYTDTLKKLERQDLEFQMNEKLDQLDMSNEASETYKRVFSSLQAAVETVAKKHGLEIVIAGSVAEFPASVEGVNPEALQHLIADQRVIYAAPGSDITQEVIAQMDASYKPTTPAPATPAK